MSNRNDYMKEYKKRKRAEKKANKFEVADYFLTLSCISLEEAEKIGSGACNGWALASCLGCWQGEDVGGIFDRVISNMSSKSNVFIENLKVWGRFLVAECVKRGLKASDSTAKKGTYRILIDGQGAWVSIQININGDTVYIKDFSGIIKSSVYDAYLSFCENELSPEASLLDIAVAMQLIYDKFNDVVSDIAGCTIKASTVAGYALKLYYSILGDGDIICGKKIHDILYPEQQRAIMDELREAKVYRGGLNYMPRQTVNYTGEAHVYDRRSFYPFIYSEFALPYGNAYERDFMDVMEARKKDDDFDGKYYVIYDVEELVASVGDNGVPCIQIINSDTGTEYLEDINFNGDVKFMLDTYDLLSLYENYNVDLLTVRKCYVWKKRKNKGLQKFAKLLYNLKESYKGEALGVVAKYLINSIIGQFGAKAYRPETIIEGGEYVRRDVKYIGEKGFLPLAMCVNSIGRWLLSWNIRQAGKYYLYGDSDSVITSVPVDLKTGETMGSFSYKKYIASKFLMRKCYGLKDRQGAWRWIVSGASPEMLKKLKSDSDFYAGKMLTGGVIPVVFDNMTIAFKQRDFTIAKQNMLF